MGEARRNENYLMRVHGVDRAGAKELRAKKAKVRKIKSLYESAPGHIPGVSQTQTFAKATETMASAMNALMASRSAFPPKNRKVRARKKV